MILDRLDRRGQFLPSRPAPAIEASAVASRRSRSPAVRGLELRGGFRLTGAAPRLSPMDALAVSSTPALRVSLPCKEPFRLDLTVAALRRLPQNPVDVFDGDRYLRAFHTEAGPVAWEVRQQGARLDVSLYGAVDDAAPYEALLRRMLGTDVDLGPFYERAGDAPAAFRPLVERFRGLKPPRTACFWETCVNTIPYQQLSLQSALTVLSRLIRATSEPVRLRDTILYPLPEPARLLRLSEPEIRAFGLSGAKARALREAAEAIRTGAVEEPALDAFDSAALARRLQKMRGVGPWTAALMLLRGFRRLEVFPAKDAGATLGLRTVLPDVDPGALRGALGPYQGMLYYHLLLAR